MHTTFEVKPKLEQLLELESVEEVMVHVRALDFLSASVEPSADRPDILDWARVESGHADAGAEEWLKNRTEMLKADLLVGMARLQRGYGAWRFNDEDTGVLGYAMDQLAAFDAAQASPDMKARFEAYVPVACLVLSQTVDDGFQNAALAEARAA